jgi:hypothetical protein
MTQKRTCLTCKNKRCIHLCRFVENAPQAEKFPIRKTG